MPTAPDDAPAAEIEARTAALIERHPPAQTDQRTFFAAQFDAGLAWVHFPLHRGGLGLEAKHQALVQRAVKAAGGPSPYRNFIGYGMAAPTLLAHGTEDQLDRFLWPLFVGDESWCQLFSEPGAGSDVASLATSATRTEGGWVLSGQKVWTTLAHTSRWGMLLARSDPSTHRHRGLTFFALDMQAPGVDVRPLRQLTGEAEFNEVFLTDVFIPDAQRIGAVGDGWRVATTTLMSERVTLGGDGTPRRRSIDDALDLAAAADLSAVQSQQLVASWVEDQLIDLIGRRAAVARRSGSAGPEGSVGKLAKALHEQEVRALGMHLLGAPAMGYDTYEMSRPERAMDAGSTQRTFLRSRATTIEGGTTEIMRNLIAERVLGLPREPRPRP